MENTGTIFRKLLLKADGINYSLIVAPFCIFFLTSFNFPSQNFMLFIYGLIGAVVLTFGLAFYFRNRRLEKLRPYFEARPDTVFSDHEIKEALKTAYGFPLFEAVMITIRWIIGACFCVFLPYEILFPEFVVEYIAANSMIFMNCLIAMPIYYLIAENETASFFRLECIKNHKIDIEEYRRIKFSTKIILTILFVILFPLVIMIIMMVVIRSTDITLDSILPGIIMLFVTTAVVSIIVAVLLKNSVKNTIETVTEGIQHISEGELRNKFPVLSADELGDLSIEMNTLVFKLNTIVGSISHGADNTRKSGKRLSRLSEDVVGAIKGIDANIDLIKTQMDELDGELGESNRSGLEVKDYIARVVDLITSQGAGINESSAAVQEMAASISNVSNRSDEKMKSVAELETKAAVGENRLNETIDVIGKINDSANVVANMNTIINKIAAQTNMLAMNAAIEAAHAGDAGRGFAVVAQEIRRLAEETTANGKGISRNLKEIIGFIELSRDAAGKTGESFKDILVEIKDVANNMHEIKDAMTELKIGSEQINSALVELLDLSSKVSSSTEPMNNKIQDITSAIDKITHISKDTKQGIDTILVSIEDLGRGMGELSRVGDENENTVEELKTVVGRFKIGGEK